MNKKEINVYNELEVEVSIFEKGANLDAFFNGEKIGSAILEEPEVNLFHKESLGELQLVLLAVKDAYEGEGVYNFLVNQCMELADTYKRVIVIENNFFSTPYLLRRGFQIESIAGKDMFVYGDYSYNLRVIDSDYFDFLDEKKLSNTDKSYINKIKEEERLEIMSKTNKIFEELQDNFIRILKDADNKLVSIGTKPAILESSKDLLSENLNISLERIKPTNKEEIIENKEIEDRNEECFTAETDIKEILDMFIELFHPSDDIGSGMA